MKPIKSKITRSLPVGSKIKTCDNSGAHLLNIISVKRLKTRKGRKASAGVGDMVIASVVKGKPDMMGQVVPALIVRQKKEYRRPDGLRVKFEDNAAIVLKDESGNPKGTIFKGAIAKEVTERWSPVAKVASIIV